jgi:DNA-directed RNA polymerase specialized sigma24 family protein
MEITRKVIDDLVKTVLKQTKGTIERAEDAAQTALEAYVRKTAKGETINEPMAFLALVAKRKYYTTLKKESKQGMYIPWHMPSNDHLEDSFLGEQNRNVLVALSQGHPIREVAEAYGLTYYRVREIKEDWINS